jgi:hypothetical protein
MDAYNILVIVLSTLLGIFLILSIIAAVMVVRLIKTLRLIVAKGEQLVDAAEEIGNAFRKNAGAAALIRMVLSFAGNMRKSSKRK